MYICPHTGPKRRTRAQHRNTPHNSHSTRTALFKARNCSQYTGETFPDHVLHTPRDITEQARPHTANKYLAPHVHNPWQPHPHNLSNTTTHESQPYTQNRYNTYKSTHNWWKHMPHTYKALRTAHTTTSARYRAHTVPHADGTNKTRKHTHSKHVDTTRPTQG